MKHQVYFGVVIRILILFSIGFFGTYIPEVSRDAFGDKPCELNIETGISDCHSATIFSIDHGWDWGARHYWFFWMCFVLFMFSLANVIWQAVNLFKNAGPHRERGLGR